MDDTASNLGRRNFAPPVSDPQILPAEGDYPRRLAARFYYFTSSKRLKAEFPDSDREQHVLAAFDLFAHISPTGRLVAL
ncbi:MAG: hypothetical protein EOO27_42505, partial [Comamonadaceae bacterium]